MTIRSKAVALRRAVTDPADWSRRQVAREAALATALALLTAGVKQAGTGGWPVLVATVLVVVVLSLLRRALPGDGGPVIDWADPQGEFGNTMSTKKTSGCLIGCGIVLVVLVGIAAAAFLGFDALSGEVAKVNIDKATYDSVQVGQDETTVRKRLPSGSSFLTSGLSGKLPPNPPGASCLHLFSDDQTQSPATQNPLSQDPVSTTENVYRFCFKGGKLIEKRELHIPN